MITQFKYILDNSEQKKIHSSIAYRLYAWLLEQLSEEDREWLHEQSDCLLNQYVYYDQNQKETCWVINLLSEEVNQLFEPILIEQFIMKLHGIWIEAKRQCSMQIQSAKELMEEARNLPEEVRRIDISIKTPVAFKREERYVILPDVHLILQSLIRKWNLVFPEIFLGDEDALAMMEQRLYVADYSLHTTRYAMKSTKIPGFYGQITMESKLPAPMEEIWRLLCAAAPYLGVGIKCTLGMGGVQVDAFEQNAEE